MELLGLTEGTALGFVTGGQMASSTCSAVARDRVLREVGWDVEADGLPGAPQIDVLLETGKHTAVTRALRISASVGGPRSRSPATTRFSSCWMSCVRRWRVSRDR